MLQVKKATVADIPSIRAITFQVWPQTYRSIISQEQIDFMLEMMYSIDSLEKQMTRDCCTFILIYDEATPIAFASYNETIPQIWKLNKIYTLPDQQGKGIGRFILTYIIAEIKKQDANVLQLQVNQNNSAKDFYLKLGFTIIQTADFDIGNGYFMRDYVMELKL